MTIPVSDSAGCGMGRTARGIDQEVSPGPSPYSG
nr:MAG TPA: hypothetical protein [Caudoviricetes sp.]